MPRAALLSIHARVDGTQPSTWEDPSLVQLWGPRFSAYVVAAEDVAVFSLGRLPDGGDRLRRSERVAEALDTFLTGRRMSYGDAGRGLGVPPNLLRYGAPTGRVLIRWDGARQSTVWTVPRPEIDPAEARLELARRFLHVLGPGTPLAYSRWAGVLPTLARRVFNALEGSLVPVRTPVGDGSILASDESSFRGPTELARGVRLLPSGDAYFLARGPDRELLVLEPEWRRALWTPRIWPGAILLDGEIVGTWRRADVEVSLMPWRALSSPERDAVQAEAESLPLPGLRAGSRTRWVAWP